MRIAQATDLSHLLKTGMPIYPGDPAVEITPAATIVPDGFNVLNVHFGSQSGTHIDAPFHFVSDGSTIDEFGPGLFLCAATVAVATGLAPNSEIAPEMIPVPSAPGGALLINTGWSKHWGTTKYFSHPYLSPHAARLIVQRGYSVVAIDALSVDQTEGGTGKFDAHMEILGADIPIAENLTNLASITWSNPWVSMLPIKIEAGDGAPIRAMAIDWAHD